MWQWAQTSGVPDRVVAWNAHGLALAKVGEAGPTAVGWCPSSRTPREGDLDARASSPLLALLVCPRSAQQHIAQKFPGGVDPVILPFDLGVDAPRGGAEGPRRSG
jgi:hypothetical protein